MLVKITKTHNRALDPRTIVKYEANAIEDLSEELAKDIIKNGFGVEYKKQKIEIENKAIFEVSENKDEQTDSTEEKPKKKK